jgi:hypothetical protein
MRIEKWALMRSYVHAATASAMNTEHRRAHFSREKLSANLDSLEFALPGLLASRVNESQFRMEFAAIAKAMEDAAGAESLEFVRSRLDRILGNSRGAAAVAGWDGVAHCTKETFAKR